MGDFEKFYNKALEFLSYRPRSEKEVRDKLKTKKVELEVIDRIISKLKEKKNETSKNRSVVRFSDIRRFHIQQDSGNNSHQTKHLLC